MDINHPLARAVIENRLELVRAHLNGLKVSLSSSIDFAGHNLLHFATMNGFHEIAALLVRSGANVNSLSKFNKTPLHFACQLGSLKLAELFVENCADLNARDLFKMTPLHWAIERNHLEIVKLLCEQVDIDLSCVDKYGRDCVRIASVKQNEFLIEILNRKLKELQFENERQHRMQMEWSASSNVASAVAAATFTAVGSSSNNKRRRSLSKSMLSSKTSSDETSEQLNDSSSSVKPKTNSKNTIRIDRLDDTDESDEDKEDEGENDSLEMFDFVRKKRQLSFSPNTMVEDTLFWLKKQVLASSTQDFTLDDRELCLTEAGRLTLKYLNENDPITSDKSLLMKMAKNYHQEEEEEMKYAATSQSNDMSLLICSTSEGSSSNNETTTTTNKQRLPQQQQQFNVDASVELPDDLNLFNFDQAPGESCLNLLNLNILNQDLNLDDLLENNN